MKKILIIFLILSGSVFSQAIPDNIILSSKINISKGTNPAPNIPRIVVSRLAEPVTTPTIISNFVSDIIVAGDTIWFGTGKGLSRTTNNGLSFQNYFGTEPFGDHDVSGIAVYKNFVVVSTAISQIINDESIPTGTGIKVSSDYGVSWNAYPQPVDVLGDDTLIYGNNHIYALEIVVPQQNLSYDIEITRKNLTSDSIVIWITSWAGELRKSVDYGQTFTRVLLPPDNLDSIYPGGNYTGANAFEYNPRDDAKGSDNHKAFSVAAENDSTIYVGTAGGINKSTDWGVSWRKYSYANTGSGSGISGNFVVGLAVQRFDNTTVIWAASNAGAQRTGEGQFNAYSYSTNGGILWRNTLDEAQFSHNMGFMGSIVYAATDNGIWRSHFTPPNFSWSKPSVIYDEELRDKINTQLFYAVNSKGDSIWVGSGDGLARTRETGSPWSEKWKIFRAYQNLSATNESYAAPNPFSPDDEVVRIFYKTGKTNSSITIKIFDFSMNYVRTVIQNAVRTDPNVNWSSWDGRRDDGTYVSNGVYFYRIEIDSDQTIWGKILVLQ